MTISVRDETVGSVHPPTVGLIGQFGLLAALASSVGLGAVGGLVGLGYAVGLWILLSRALQQPGVRWGPADTVTLTRAVLTGGVLALVADTLAGADTPLAALVALAAVALAMDAVDGQVARRTGTASPLGARFDMEVDSVLVMVLSVFVALTLGWWVVAIGLYRYAFWLAGFGLPWLRGYLAPKRWRKVVAATQGIVLVVVSAGVLPVPLAAVAVGVSLAMLTVAFGRDIGWLWLTRPKPLRQGDLQRVA
ncbi:MAG TPA: CDP-alcohol phosphatidyltransferase family protein [Natronosporangium sp.]